MRTIETTVYQFHELSEDAKEKAREWYKQGDVYGWSDEYRHSIETFCAHFGVELKDWNIGPGSPIDYRTDAENAHFRGLKLRDLPHDQAPTGFCGDYALWVTFEKEFKRTGDALAAFNSALDAGFKEWRDDWESAYSDEAVDEAITANGYEFTEEGERA
jgi:hypothetical protein